MNIKEELQTGVGAASLAAAWALLDGLVGPGEVARFEQDSQLTLSVERCADPAAPVAAMPLVGFLGVSPA